MIRNALSCSYIDVNNAVNGGGPFPGPAATGDVVNIPANVLTGGTFVLHGVTFDWDVSSAAMKTGLVGAGLPAGITVIGDHFDGWKITWPTIGPQTVLTGSASGITPTGLTLTVSRAVEGDVNKGHAEIQYISITDVWPTQLTITKGITLQGQTDRFYTASTLVTSLSFVDVSTLSNSLLHVVSTDGFNPNGGILDICTSAISDTACGQLTYTSIINSTTFGGVSLGASPDWASTPIGTLNAFSFIGQGVCRDRSIIGCGKNQIIVMSPTAGICTVTGLSFRQACSLQGGNGYIVFTKPNCRFHHNHMGSRIGSLLYVYFDVSTPPAVGVIDHNVVDNPAINSTGGQNQISYSTSIPAGSGTDATWSKPSAYGDAAGYGRGGPNQTYFEYNYFWSNSYTGGSGGRCVWDGSGGMRVVVRRNHIWNYANFNHGTEGGTRGGIRIENYSNTAVAELGASLEAFSTRSGSYIINNNRYYGPLADLTGTPGAFRSVGAVYASAGMRSGAFGWNPWDSNDVSNNGPYVGCKRPDASTPSPSSTLGAVGTSGFTYNPVRGRYVVSAVTDPSGAASFTPTLTDMSKSWLPNQWIDFQASRVSRAGSGSLGIALLGSVDLSTLTGTQTVPLSPNSGQKLYTMTGQGVLSLTLGCLTIPGSPDKYILFQKIIGDSIYGCWSPDTGMVSGTVESGDMWQGQITASGQHTLTVRIASDNGIKVPASFAVGDKYIVARCLSVIDSPCRGPSELLSKDAAGFWINTSRTPPIAIWPRNKLEPYYNWNNIQPRTGNRMVCGDANNSLFVINRDFFNDNVGWTPGNPVLTGIASGLLADRPNSNPYSATDVTGASTVVPSVGYWATDDGPQGSLYVMTAAGWLLWWRPYDDPHPLTLGPATQSITSAPSVSFVSGTGGTFQAASFGFSAAPIWSFTGTLPTGTSFDSTGLLTVGGSTAAGSYSFTITATNGSEIASQGFTLTVAAATTRIIGITGPVTFGNVDINTTSTKTLTISNTGTAVLTVTSITLPSGFTANWTSGTIAVGGSQQVIITFAPLTATLYSGTITVASDKTSGTNTTSISGTGASRVIGLSGSLAFGSITVGQTATRQLTISNSGNVPLAITAITYPEGFSGDLVSASIAAGASKILNVTFSPLAAQVYSGNLVIQSDKTSGTSTVAASGTGVATPTKIIQLTGNLAFGSVQTGGSVARVLTLTNSGTALLTVTSISFPTGFSGDWTSGTIAAGASQDINVTFSPVSAIAYSGSVTVTSDATGGSNTISASGTGVAPATKIIGLSGSMAFGNVVVGSSTTRTLAIANTGSAPLTVTGITYPPGFTGAFSGTIAPGASQNVTVTFSPLLFQSYDGTITVASDATSGTGTIAATGSGVAPTTRVISLAGNLAFGNVQKNHTAQRILAITNNGTDVLAVSNITLPTGFSANWTSGSIPSGATQNVTITFAPTTAQSYGGTVTVVSNKTSGTNTMPCSGTGRNKKQVPFILIVA